MISLFSFLFYNPIYNLFVLILDVITSDVGIAIIIVTIIVKIILFPFAKQAIKTQIGMKKIKPELEKIQKKFKSIIKSGSKEEQSAARQEQAIAMMNLYKENNIKPFSSILTLLIQLPVLIALYLIFYKGGLPSISSDILYSFIPIPEQVNMIFVGIFDLSAHKNIFLALCAGIIQALHSHISLEVPPAKSSANMSEDFARTFTIQMKYGLPLLIAGTAYFFGSAIALYLITSTSFMLFQELLVRKDKAKLKSI